MKLNLIKNKYLALLFVLGVSLYVVMPHTSFAKTASNIKLTPECSKILKNLGEAEATLVNNPETAKNFKQKYKNTPQWEKIKTACGPQGLESCSAESCGCGFWPKCEECTSSCGFFTCCYWHYCDGDCYSTDSQCKTYCGCVNKCRGNYNDWISCRKKCTQ